MSRREPQTFSCNNTACIFFNAIGQIGIAVCEKSWKRACFFKLLSDHTQQSDRSKVVRKWQFLFRILPCLPDCKSIMTHTMLHKIFSDPVEDVTNLFYT